MKQISFFGNVFVLTTYANQQEYHAKTKTGWPLLKDNYELLCITKTQHDCVTDSKVSPNTLF